MMNETDSEDSDPEAETTGVEGHQLAEQVCRGREIFHTTRDILPTPMLLSRARSYFRSSDPTPIEDPPGLGRPHAPGHAVRPCGAAGGG